MDKTASVNGCAIWSCIAAGLAGFFAALMLIFVGGWLPIQGFFVGILGAAIGAPLLIWLICKPMPALGEAPVPGSDEKLQAVEPAAGPAPAAAAPAAPEAEIQPSARLAGEEELAARKGDWKYEADEPAAPAAEVEHEGPGTKPETLTAAREGGPDNLKEIKGVGPKLEELLHSMGFYHFDQVASWGAEEVAWVDQNLQGFKGRVSRDDWVAQAKILAAGGATEFSKKVEDGGVYE